MINWNNFFLFAAVSIVLWAAGAAAALLSRNRSRAAILLSSAGTAVFAFFVAGLWISLERPPLRTMGDTRLAGYYEPIVDIRRVKAESEADMAAALAEVCKYAAKPADYLVPEDMDLTAQTVAVLDKQLHHRRMTAFGGDLFRLAKELHLDSVEDGDLIHIDQDAAAAAPTSIYDDN